MSLTEEKLLQLSPKQVKKLETVSNQWRNIGLSTAKTDHQAAEEGLRRAYEAAGLAAPRFIVWLKSPRAGATAARLLKSDLDWPHNLDPMQRGVWDDVWKQSVPQVQQHLGAARWAEVRKTIRQEAEKRILDKYGHYVEHRVKERFSEQIGIWVWKYIRKNGGQSVLQQVRVDVEERVKRSLKPEVAQEAMDQIYQQMVVPVTQQTWAAVAEPLRMMMAINNGTLVGRQTWECGFGSQDAGWISHYDYLRAIGVKGTELLEGITAMTRSCGWWWPYRNLCVLTEKPTGLKRDNRGRLHNEKGMVVRYADNWGFYAWHGVIVPDDVIILKEPITLERIAAERNVEVRRVLIERFGLDDYLKSGKVIKIHQDKCGTLWRMDLEGDEPIMVVQVVNSTAEPEGYFKEYFLRVPPDMVRAKQAVAWTFGLTEDEYVPLAET
jgi:hypothetical protein